MTELDRKANEVFGGKVVRKDLVRKVKVGANVPVYVLEYLIGKYCASYDPKVVEAGLRLINTTIAENFVRPDEANKAHFRVKDRGDATFIDKVRVRVLEDKDWAELVNFGHQYIHIQTQTIKDYPRVLEGGIWAQVEIEYRQDEETGRKSRPFFITGLKPIQLAGFDFDEYREGRARFTTDEWIDLMVRSVGLEPAHFDRRTKLLFLSRLIPMVEKNFNLIELGPRGTGKSFVYREMSPYTILISGGRTTVANLFYNMSTKRVGLVGMWDVVAFDEVAGINFSDKSAVSIMKDYMESGSFSRGREEIVADASMVFVGNINQPVEILTKMSNLFQPLPEAMQDMALIDRFHFYLPGWETPKMQTKHFTDHYGFISDYIAEAFRILRKENFTERIDHYYALGSHLNARDVKAVRKAVSGLLKILHPHGEFTQEELQEYLTIAIECRRRVKEQLKKMGSFEYYKTSFSYIENETREEFFVGVPEEGGRNLISPDPLPPGSVYTAAFTNWEKVSLHRIEVSRMSGTGKIKVTGSPDKSMKESIMTAFDYIKARRHELGIERDVMSYDFHVQLVDLMAAKEGSEAGVAFFVALYSLLRNQPVLPGLIILGEMTIQGNILPVKSLMEPLQVAIDNGARKVLLPIESKRQFLEVPGDIMVKVDPIFYADPGTAAIKAIGQ